MHNEEFHICGNLKIDFLGLRHFQQYRGTDALPGLNRIHRCKADKFGGFSMPLDFLPLSLIWEIDWNCHWLETFLSKVQGMVLGEIFPSILLLMQKTDQELSFYL